MAEPMNLLFYNQAMDRAAMKQLIGRLVAHLGATYTAHILDQLKTLGFKNATQAGISLGIDDLLTAPSKAWLIQDAEHQTHISEEHQRYGNIHAVEKLRQLIETWYTTSEYLRHEMNPNFRITDPLNPVHMMSFSGARGSSSQVHQLVGMRGLMSDPQGQIIDLPIQSNFREGLSLTEYIISCYGARKGVVDTAVRTSDAEYLTRRLVEVVQHVVVRRIDCGTTHGIRFRPIQERKVNSHLSFQNKLIGRVLANYIYVKKRCIAARNQDITVELASRLANCQTEAILVRSTLTCKSMHWVCQLCYGWSLNHGSLIELGEAVGIIAGQSIGEPGTQLTLRTFHTGGVFTGDIAEHVRAPFNGLVHFDSNLVKSTRTRHGHPAWICKTTIILTVKGQGKQHTVTIPPHSLLLTKNNQNVQSKQVIAEIRATATPFKEKVQKYIYSNLEGEMHWSKRVQHGSKYTHGDLHSVVNTGHVWVLSGRIDKHFGVNNIFYKDQDHVNTNVPLAKKESLLYSSENKLLYKKCIFQKNRPNQKKNKELEKTFFSTKKSSLAHPKEIDATVLLSNYKVVEKDGQISLISETYKKESLPFIFNLCMPLHGISKHQDILAYGNDLRYKTETSGILKYGSLKTDSPNRSINSSSNEEQSIKDKKKNLRIIQGGSLFWIPEEIHSLHQSLSSILVKEGDWIEPNTKIASNLYSQSGGLVKIRRTTSNAYEISILPGNAHYPKQLQQGMSKHDTLVSPGTEIIEGVNAKVWSYLQWIVLAKGRPFLLIRPVIQYNVPTVPTILTPTLLNFLGKKDKIKVDIVQYLLYEDGQHIKAVNGTQLIQTCLVLKLNNNNMFDAARIACVEVKFGFVTNRYLQITLSGSKLLSLPCKDYIHFVKKYDNIVDKSGELVVNQPANTKKIVSQYQGIIRSLAKTNKKNETFLTLSSSDQLRIKISSCSLPQYSIKDLSDENLSQNLRFSSSSERYKIYKENIQVPHIDIFNTNERSSIFNKVNDRDTKDMQSFRSLGLIGHLHNSFCSRIEILLTKSKLNTSNNYNISNIEKYATKFNWYFLDENKKTYKFYYLSTTFPKKTNFYLNPVYFSKTLQALSLGQFVSEGLNIDFNNLLPEAGQIIALNPNDFIIRLAKPYLATMGATIHSHYGEAIREGDTLLTLVYERLKTGDIIQGLPKVEQLLEARPINTVSINLEDGFENWNKDITRFLGNPWGFLLSARISIEQSQIDLVDQIQRVYQSQGVYISDKHVEVIVRQMTSKVVTLEDGMANGFLPGELIELPKAQRMNRALQEPVPYKPILLGITKVSLNTQSFISEASFQETTRVLTRAALKGRTDWLKGLKENVVLGGLIPAGTGCQEAASQIKLDKERINIRIKRKDLFKSEVKNVFFPYGESLSRSKYFLHKILRQSFSQRGIRDLVINTADKQKKN